MVYPVIEWVECGISHGIRINDMGFLISFLDISPGEISMSIWLWSICWISHGIVGESCHESGNIWAYPGWWFGTFFNFPYIGNDHPNWLSYFSDGLKPPTSINIMFFIYHWIGYAQQTTTKSWILGAWGGPPWKNLQWSKRLGCFLISNMDHHGV